MNKDIHLKFDSQQQAQQLLLESGVWQQIADEVAPQTIDAPGYLTDEIGLIFKETGTMLTDPDDESLTYPEMAAIPGWHINMRGDVPAAIQPFVVQVNSPYRIWD